MTPDEQMMQAKMTALEYFDAAERHLEASEREFKTADVIALATIMTRDFESANMWRIANALESIALAATKGSK